MEASKCNIKFDLRSHANQQPLTFFFLAWLIFNWLSPTTLATFDGDFVILSYTTGNIYQSSLLLEAR